MKKIILAYVVSTLGRTGPTRQLYNLVKYLDHDQFQVKLITLSQNPSNNLEKEFSGLNVDLHPLRMNRPSSLLIGRRRLNAVLKIIKPDYLVKGPDYEENEIVGTSFIKSYVGKVIRIPLIENHSSSYIINKIINS